MIIMTANEPWGFFGALCTNGAPDAWTAFNDAAHATDRAQLAALIRRLEAATR